MSLALSLSLLSLSLLACSPHCPMPPVGLTLALPITFSSSEPRILLFFFISSTTNASAPPTAALRGPAATLLGLPFSLVSLLLDSPSSTGTEH
ncbi:hypothetical protein CEXT_715101 [Caerostris extrusa]|uniref:Secreted protein n=1 Tax=Caerostris extrusa TaxID=172846 RepID=A0AAV4PT85_CAEEX|nr:hypothetical protein CEXT_715101 [Caerostris extrusa]